MKNEGHASIYARWFILPTLIGVYFAFPNLPSLTFHQSGALGLLLKKKKLQWHPRHHTYSCEAKIKIHDTFHSLIYGEFAGVHHL